MSDQTGGGVENIIKGIEHAPKHLWEDIETLFGKAEELDPAIKAALPYIKNSWSTIAADIKKNGEPIIAQAATSISGTLESAAAGTTDKTAAGKTAILTAKTAVEAVSEDTLHIITTDLLTDAAGIVGKIAAAV